MDRDNNDGRIGKKVVLPKLETKSTFSGGSDDTQLLPTLQSTIDNAEYREFLASLFDACVQNCPENQRRIKRELSKLWVHLNNQPMDLGAIMPLFRTFFSRTIPPPISRPRSDSSNFEGKFKFVGKLGHGGCGHVYKVFNDTDGKHYAIKRIKVLSGHDKQLKEAIYLSGLEHPNIVRYHIAWCSQEDHHNPWTCSSSDDEEDEDCTSSCNHPEANGNNMNKSDSDDFIVFAPDCVTPDEPDSSTSLNGEIENNSNINYKDQEHQHQNEDVLSSSISQLSNIMISEMNANKLSSSSHSCPITRAEQKSKSCTNDVSANNFYYDNVSQGFDVSEAESFCFEKKDKKSSVKITVFDESCVDKSSTSDCESSLSRSFSSEIVQVGGRQTVKPFSVVRSNSLKQEYMFLNILMELCDNTLRNWLDTRNQSDCSEVCCIDDQKNKGIYKQILDAVAYIHSKDLMHRDLKPSNIFFTDGKIKIGDFGFACQSLYGDCINCNNKTHGVGTTHYISPEMKETSEGYDHKTDIYSLGVILYEMYVLLPTKMEAAKHLSLIAEGRIEKMDKFQKQFDLMEEMTAKDPVQRPEAKDILRRDIFQ